MYVSLATCLNALHCQIIKANAHTLVLWLRLFIFFFDLVVLFMQRPKYKKLIFK